MTTPTEPEVEAAAEVAYLRNRAGSTSWRDLPENHKRVWREKVTPILTAAAQVRAQEQQKFVDDFLAQGGRIIPTEPADDYGEDVLGLKGRE